MGVDFQISGAEQLDQLIKQLKAADKGLGREMGRALSKVVAPISRAIDKEAGLVAPSGYQDDLARSLKHRRNVRNTSRQASVRLTTYAKGKAENRDLPKLNAGELRHPVFGRSRRTKKGRIANPWSVTKVRSGFHDRGIETAGDQAEKQLWTVIDDFTQRLG